jgi:UDP-N-acetylglucosamine 2-epimerase (non-hydrolysing)
MHSEKLVMLGFLAILIRASIEKPEVLEKGTIVIDGTAEKNIHQTVELCQIMWENKELNNVA